MTKAQYEELMNTDVNDRVWLSKTITATKLLNAIEVVRYVGRNYKSSIRTTAPLNGTDYKSIKSAVADCKSEIQEFKKFHESNGDSWLHGMTYNA